MAADARRVRRRLAANCSGVLLLMVGVAIGAQRLRGRRRHRLVPARRLLGPPLLALSATGDAVARLPCGWHALRAHAL